MIDLEYKYRHFNRRLIQRYNMSITFEEYKKLKPNKIFYKTKCNSNFCTIIVNGKEIFAISDTNTGSDINFIRTVMLEEFGYPVPNGAKYMFKRAGWMNFVKEVLEYVNSEIDNMDINTSNRDIFNKYPVHIASLITKVIEKRINGNVSDFDLYLLIVKCFRQKRNLNKNLKWILKK